MNPECFGREYVDSEGGECPHVECLLRYECKDVFSVARGILSLKDKVPVGAPKKLKIDKSVRKKRSGYIKPGRLLYQDEGTLRDKIVFILRDFLEKEGFSVRATKCLHSFMGADKKFVLKADTRRKNSVIIYVGDALMEFLSDQNFKFRELFESERPNFPQYLLWATYLRSESDVDKFMLAFDEWKN